MSELAAQLCAEAEGHITTHFCSPCPSRLHPPQHRRTPPADRHAQPGCPQVHLVNTVVLSLPCQDSSSHLHSATHFFSLLRTWCCRFLTFQLPEWIVGQGPDRPELQSFLCHSQSLHQYNGTHGIYLPGWVTSKQILAQTRFQQVEAATRAARNRQPGVPCPRAPADEAHGAETQPRLHQLSHFP